MAKEATTAALLGAKNVISLILVVSLWSGAAVVAAEKEYHNEGDYQFANLTTAIVGENSISGRASLTALCLVILKVIKLACVCTFFLLLFLFVCPFIPLILPVFVYSLVFAFFLVVLIGFVPIPVVRPPAPATPQLPVAQPSPGVPDTTPPPIVIPPVTLPPPFVSIPAILRPIQMPPPFVSIPARQFFEMGIWRI